MAKRLTLAKLAYDVGAIGLDLGQVGAMLADLRNETRAADHAQAAINRDYGQRLVALENDLAQARSVVAQRIVRLEAINVASGDRFSTFSGRLRWLLTGK